MLALGVARETVAGDHRVALTPDTIGRLNDLGLAVLVQTGAGAAAWYTDSDYREAGADVVTAVDLYARSDIVVSIGGPDLVRMRPGSVAIGMLDDAAVAGCLARGVTAVSLLRLPRTLSRGQAMDALTSQASIAGYKAAVLAADTYGRFLPMMMTAAGTARPASVLVLGAGVAGLAAIGTARRLGAVVTGYDIRAEAADEIRSVGARLLELKAVSAGAAAGGYARHLTDAERAAQQVELQDRIGAFDIVITTAQLPGRVPPVLVTEEALKSMRPGSVVVDLAAGPHGGNVDGSKPDATVVIADGVTVIGAGNLPSAMAPAASAAYSRNVAALLTHLVRDGALAYDPGDAIQVAIVATATRDGVPS